MSPAALLADLQARRVKLVARDGKITFRAPVGVLTGQDRDAITRHREALLRLLGAPSGLAESEPPAARRGAPPSVAPRQAAEPGARESDQDPAGEDPPGVRQAEPTLVRDPPPDPVDLAGPPPVRDPEPPPVYVVEPPSLSIRCPPLERTAPAAWLEPWPAPEGASCQGGGGLPLLALFEEEGQAFESWLLPQGAAALPVLEDLGARILPVGKWTRADLPAGGAPAPLLPFLLAACSGVLEPPAPELLSRREALSVRPPEGTGRVILPPSVLAETLECVAPAPSPPEGLPDACPACRSRSPKWKALENPPGRFLCGRCWKPWQGSG